MDKFYHWTNFDVIFEFTTLTTTEQIYLEDMIGISQNFIEVIYRLALQKDFLFGYISKRVHTHLFAALYHTHTYTHTLYYFMIYTKKELIVQKNIQKIFRVFFRLVMYLIVLTQNLLIINKFKMFMGFHVKILEKIMRQQFQQCMKEKGAAVQVGILLLGFSALKQSLEISDNANHHTICFGCLVMGILFLH